jgi:hypothetical protein
MKALAAAKEQGPTIEGKRRRLLAERRIGKSTY